MYRYGTSSNGLGHRGRRLSWGSWRHRTGSAPSPALAAAPRSETKDNPPRPAEPALSVKAACCADGANKGTLLALASPRANSTASAAQAAGKKPNILVIWGDDIGVHNISAYNHGIMGYGRPTSIAWLRKARCLPTSTPSKAARRGGRRSSWGSIRSAPAC